jgi:hypothetical protein
MNVAPASGTIAASHRVRRADAKWVRMYRVEAWIEQGGKCAYCHQPIARAAATADHVEAIIDGGSTTRKNIKAACLPCNQTKGHLSAGAFLKLIKDPPTGGNIHLWLAWSRRRIGLRVERAVTRIQRSVMT